MSARKINISTDDALYQASRVNGDWDTQLLGLQGHGGARAVIQDCRDSGRLFAATGKDGMLRSDDGGKTWQDINRGITYKEMWSLAQHPKTGELYAGTGPSSVFKSSDAGESWADAEQLRSLPTTIDWTFPRPPHVSHIRGIGLCEQDPSVISCAIEEGWIVRSKDGGHTWENIKNGVEFDAHSITYMPNDPSVILATTGRGVFRSTDGGDSYERSEAGMDRKYMAQIAVHPKRPNVLFTAGAAVPPPMWRRPEGADSAFFRSEDQGKTWTRLGGGLPDNFKPAPRYVAGDLDDPDAVFVGTVDGSVWFTEDGGESFSQIVQGLPGSFIRHIAAVRD
ncbi:MAG: hypothetical protein JOZ39_05625 [Chloroflexi bacterium]|nr:hypothetical protein [Chloroflexota bacterium]